MTAPKKRRAGKSQPGKGSKPKRGAPVGNSNALGNPGGGRPSGCTPEVIAQAKKLCEAGFTDNMLADFFEVSESTINNWKTDIEFLGAITVGKDAADAIVERSTYNAINGFERNVEKAVAGIGVVTVKEYYPPNPGMGLRWLARRQPEIYREKTESKQTVEIGTSFLKLLEHIETQGKLDSVREKKQLIDRANAIDIEV